MKTYEGNGITIKAFKRGGYLVLRIQELKTFYVATKHSRKPHVETAWMPEYEKKFEFKEQANKYFRAIKNSHTDIQMVANEPNKYINHKGEVAEF